MYAGETVTPTGPDGPVIVIVEVAMREVSAALTAVRVTGLVAGTLAGAKKSTGCASGPAGGWHGFDPARHIKPGVALPFAMPFTNHDTAASVVPETAGVRVVR